MDKQLLEDIIRGLTLVQIQLENQRRDHNGQVLKHDDIDHMNVTIKILEDLKIDNKIIWQKK